MLKGDVRSRPSTSQFRTIQVCPKDLRSGRGLGQIMKNRKQFAHRIDMWDDDGENIVEHLAAVGDFDLAVATYRAACLRWPNAAITLRQGTRVIEDSRKRRLASR
jgi:hypothetical protein